ncbi:nucleotidyltransferase family protein [bacterium]|nr:MAG: nucleotidyltransferase family protein [bacterium]MCL4229981.1 nucleotidyltransferase family protein [Dehalococcoidia bacterium]
MISSIILAAGSSDRMGSPKALLDWGGEPLICWEIQQLREAGVDEVIVVLGHRSDDVRRALARVNCRVMNNPHFHSGRAESVRIGAKAVQRDAEAIVIVNVDQPRPAEFIRALIVAHQGGNGVAVTRPVVAGRHGHPVVVAGSMREELMAASDATEGMRGVLHAHANTIADIPADDLCEVDINTPDDYRAALRRFGIAG